MTDPFKASTRQSKKRTQTLRLPMRFPKAGISYIVTRCTPESVWDAFERYLEHDIHNTASGRETKAGLHENNVNR